MLVEQNMSVRQTSSVYAAIYLFGTKESTAEQRISTQVIACKNFIDSQGWVFSGDLFVERKASGNIDRLARARAWFQRFDYIVSYVQLINSQPEQDQRTIKGIIACYPSLVYAKLLVKSEGCINARHAPR